MAITYVSVGGASDRAVHDEFRRCATRCGVYLSPGNYFEYNAPPIAIAGPLRASDFLDRIFHLFRSQYRVYSFFSPGGSWSNIPPFNATERWRAQRRTFVRDRRSAHGPNPRLCLVGKSAGAIQIWNLLRLHPLLFSHFHRIAAVLIDPHGAVWEDGETGSYRDSRPLTWPSTWPYNNSRFRIYHVFQHVDGPTGAPFLNRQDEICRINDPRVSHIPSDSLYESCRINDPRVSHTNIPEHPIVREMITRAIMWIVQQA